MFLGGILSTDCIKKSYKETKQQKEITRTFLHGKTKTKLVVLAEKECEIISSETISNLKSYQAKATFPLSEAAVADVSTVTAEERFKIVVVDAPADELSPTKKEKENRRIIEESP